MSEMIDLNEYDPIDVSHMVPRRIVVAPTK
jgi:hypothetical protein